MSAAVSIMLCYVGEGNGDVCCSYYYGLLQGGGQGGKW